MKFFYLALPLICLLNSQVLAKQVTNNKNQHNFPGGIADIQINKESDSLPTIKFGVNEPVIIEQEDSWRVLVGLSLSTIPGEYLLYLKRNIEDSTSEHVNFYVKQKSYPIVELERKSKKRIRQTHKKITELEYSNTQQPSLPLNLPTQGIWNTEFGSIHHNKKRKKLVTQNLIHLQTSNIISVKAPQNALISNIVKNEDGSSTVFLDHGRGLFSVISGLTEINIEIGNGVLSGAVIGKVTPDADYKTATVSTRFLTWQCILNGIYVNPIILTQL